MVHCHNFHKVCKLRMSYVETFKLLKFFNIFCFATLSFCISNPMNKENYTLAWVKENINDEDGIREENFIGLFPHNNDTITIYKITPDIKIEKQYAFSSKMVKKDSTIIFYFFEDNLLNDTLKVVFDKGNISVGNDVYTVNKQYYIFLKQKILIEKSILELTFLTKDGYGDYANLLEPLNKNWKNEKENKTHKIIKAYIRNENFQSDNQYFTYNVSYTYLNGNLKCINSLGNYKKKFIGENSKYMRYAINYDINERSSYNIDSYKNKKTLYDSIVVDWEQYTTEKKYHYTKYQSGLKLSNINEKPNNLTEIVELLK